MLDKLALIVIFLLLIMVTVAIVLIGSLPGKIARKRDHPWPDAVNAASWIGLATGVLWPLAFVWAFLPLPARAGDGSGDAAPNEDHETLERRIAELEATNKQLLAKSGEGSV